MGRFQQKLRDVMGSRLILWKGLEDIASDTKETTLLPMDEHSKLVEQTIFLL